MAERTMADLREMVASARALLAAGQAINDDQEDVGDDHPLWSAFEASARRFEEAVGIGFAAEADAVAEVLLAFAPAVDGYRG